MTSYGCLFQGMGGLELGLREVFGGEPAWCAEIDPAASAVIAARFPGVPNLGDVSVIDFTKVPGVDILTGGVPCQGISLAGLRLGLADHRSGLWSEMARAVAELRPSLVVLENVRGLTSARAAGDVEPCPGCMGDGNDEPTLRALGAVLGDLADLRYDAWWTGLRAADVGAPHERFRIFVFAWPADPDRAGLEGSERTWRRNVSAWGAVADAASERRDGTGGARAGRAGSPDGDQHASDSQREPRGERRVTGSRETPWGGACGDVGGCGGVPADTESDRRDEGRTESARLIGRRDAVQRGCGAVPDTDNGPGEPQRPRQEPRRRSTDPAHADSSRREDRPQRNIETDAQAAERGAQRRDADRCTCSEDEQRTATTAWGRYEAAVRRWEQLTRPAPTPTEPRRATKVAVRDCAWELGLDGWAATAMVRLGLWGALLSPPFVEWMQGLPEGWVTDVPGLTRNDKLRLLGNGVVPPQAAEAARRFLAGAVS